MKFCLLANWLLYLKIFEWKNAQFVRKNTHSNSLWTSEENVCTIISLPTKYDEMKSYNFLVFFWLFKHFTNWSLAFSTWFSFSFSSFSFSRPSLVQRFFHTDWCYCIDRLSNGMSTTAADYNGSNHTNETSSSNKCPIMGWCTGKDCHPSKTATFGCGNIRCQRQIDDSKTKIGSIGWWKAATIKCEHWNPQCIFIWNGKQFTATIGITATATAITPERTNWQ